MQSPATMQDQPARKRWGWVCDNEVQEWVFSTASAAIRDMGKRIAPNEEDEIAIVEKAERHGFRLVMVVVSMRVEAFLSPYPMTAPPQQQESTARTGETLE